MEALCNRYFLKEKIGKGSFGEIYVVESMKTGKEYAAKIENKDIVVPQLLFESRVYDYMAGCTNVPRLHFSEEGLSQNVIVIDLLGKSLEKIKKEYNKLSLKSVLMLADQMISAVQFFHEKSYIHRDIKPDNFVFGHGKDSHKLFIIDYGLAKRYRDIFTHEHLPFSSGKSLTGTARYASINAMKGNEQSRRDDMESIGYVLIYLLKEKLPWMGVDGATRKEKFSKICEIKEKCSLSELCKGLPHQFKQYVHSTRKLKFDETPDYSGYKKMFRDLFIQKNFTYDYVYDWTNDEIIKREAYLGNQIPQCFLMPNKRSRRRINKESHGTSDSKFMSLEVARGDHMNNTLSDYITPKDANKPLPKVPKDYVIKENTLQDPIKTPKKKRKSTKTKTKSEKTEEVKKKKTRAKISKRKSVDKSSNKVSAKSPRKTRHRKEQRAKSAEIQKKRFTEEIFNLNDSNDFVPHKTISSKQKTFSHTDDLLCISCTTSFVELPAQLIFNDDSVVPEGKVIKKKHHKKEKRRSRSVERINKIMF